MKPFRLFLLVMLLAGIVGTASAGFYPVPGAGTNVTYNSFDTTLAGCTGGGVKVNVAYGLSPGSYSKQTPPVEAQATDWLVHVTVASGYEGQPIYYLAWDATLGFGQAYTVYLVSDPGTLTAGAATDVNANGFNTTVAGFTGSSIWIEFGEYSGKLNWKSPVYAATGNNETVQVIGAPLYGGQNVYYRACDGYGCSAEVSTTLLAVTTMPTLTYKQGITNVTNSRFNPLIIGATIIQGYTQVTGATIVFGIMFMFFMIGVWMRTKSVRLIAIIGILISPLIMYSSSGLFMGMPLIGQALAQGLLAAGLAGVFLSFIKR